jgi:hypothetical protein
MTAIMVNELKEENKELYDFTLSTVLQKYIPIHKSNITDTKIIKKKVNKIIRWMFENKEINASGNHLLIRHEIPFITINELDQFLKGKKTDSIRNGSFSTKNNTITIDMFLIKNSFLFIAAVCNEYIAALYLYGLYGEINFNHPIEIILTEETE